MTSRSRFQHRAWDTEEGIMRYDIAVTPSGYAEAPWGKEKHDWLLQQNTGAIDSKGNAIWEGDIIYASGNNSHYVVTYGQWDCEYGADEGCTHYGWCMRQAGGTWKEGLDTQCEFLTVIGNICEHKERDYE